MILLSCSSILLQILGTIYRIIIVRLAGAEGMGVYQLVFPFYAVVMAACISGLSIAVSRISAEKYALHDNIGIRKLIRTSIGIFIIMLAVISLITVLFLEPIANAVLGDSRTKTAILAILVCLFFTGFENIYKSYFYGIKNVHPPILSDILEQIIRIGAVAALLYFLHPKDGGICAALIVAGMIISEVVSSFCMKVFYESAVSPVNAYGKQYKGMVKTIANIAVPIAFGGLVNNIIGAANTVLIPQRLVVAGLSQQSALEDLGILFGMVIPLLMLPSVFIGSLSTIIMPTLSQDMILQDHGGIKRKVGKAFRTTGIITFPSITIMIALGSELCYELYGQADTQIYFLPLAIASIFVYFQIISGSILNGLGMQKYATANIIIAGFVQLGFTYFLTGDPRFGIHGYIAGYLISDVLLMVLHMYFVLRRIKMRIQWGSWFILPAISATFVGILTRMAFDYIKEKGLSQPISLIGAIGFGIMIYYVLLQVEGIKVKKYFRSMIH